MEIKLSDPYFQTVVITAFVVASIFTLYQLISYYIQKQKQKQIKKEISDEELAKAKEILEKPIKKKSSKLIAKSNKPIAKTVIKDEIKEDDKFRELRPYIPIKLKLTDINTWKTYIISKFQSDRTVLINMELLNGINRLFLVTEKQGGFTYRKKQYIFDNDSKYYILEAKMYAFDFHEGFVLPIKRKLPVEKLKQQIKDATDVEVEYATNPDTLQNFMVAKIAEGIMKGAEIDAWMKQIRLILMIVGVVSLIHFLMYLQKSGVFSQLM